MNISPRISEGSVYVIVRSFLSALRRQSRVVRDQISSSSFPIALSFEAGACVMQESCMEEDVVLV